MALDSKKSLLRPMREFPFWPILLLLAVFWFSLIGLYGFIGPEEPRYARIPQEMTDRGDWVVPILKGYPWLEKPPLLYWGIMVSDALFGRTEFAARFPSALLALLFTGVLYWSLHDVFGRRTAFFAALGLGTSALYSAFAMAAVMDMHLTVFLGTGLLLFWRSWLGFEGKFPTRHPNLLFWAAGLSFGISCLAKGLLSLAIPSLVIVPFLLIAGGWRHYLHLRLLPGILLFLAASLPWHLLMIQRVGFHFVLVYFINHHFARFFTSIHHHSQPFYYYLPVLAFGFLPWSPFLLKLRGLKDAVQRARTDPHASGTAFALCWLVFPFLFFSVSEAKLAGYVLPLLPALAILVSLGLERFFSAGQPDRTVAALVAGIPAAVGLALPIFLQIRFGDWRPGVLLGLGFLAGAAGFLFWFTKGRRAYAAVACAMTIMLPAGIGIPLFFKKFEPEFNRRQICQAALRLVGPSPNLLVFQNQHHSIDYYTHYTCSDNITDPGILLEEIRSRRSPAYVLTLEENVSHLALPPDHRVIPCLRVSDSVLLRIDRERGVSP